MNKNVIQCWIRSEPIKRKYRQRMKEIWKEIEVFPVTRQIRTKNWFTFIEIEEIRRKLERKNRKVEVEENDHESIEHNKNMQG